MATSLNQFLTEKGLPSVSPTPKPITLAETPSVGVSDVIKELPSAAGTELRWIGKQLMKPTGAVATLAEQTAKSIGTESMQPLKEAPQKIADVLTGKTERSWADIYRENFPNKTAGTIIGTVVDIAADPLNFLGGAPAKAIKGVSKLAGRVPGVSATAKAVKPLISTKTSNKQFDLLIDHYRSLGDYRRAEVIDGARQVQKVVDKLKPDEVVKVSSVIETGTKTGNKAIDDLATKLSDTYKKWKTVEKEMGIAGGEVAQYAPHIKVKEPKGIVGIAKEFTSRLGGAEKGRKIMKFVADDGDEIIGKANSLGLKEVKEGFKDSSGKLYKPMTASVEEINTAFGKKFFEENPAIQSAYRGISHAKAVTGREFLEQAKKFASKEGVESAQAELKGLKFEPDMARQIDNYYESIRPQEIKAVLKTYDGILNWWKAQALVAPAYHTRNIVSNIWNAFLAGVKSPVDYVQAGLVQTGKTLKFKDKVGRVWNEKNILNVAKRTGVIDEGWYAKDIPTAIGTEINKWNFNPVSQRNVAFKLNKAAGSAFENNARLAVFINQLKKGSSIDDAALTVKKFLFDYGDLTKFEQTVLKRIFPFYTWTRKNLPLQLENLVKQPGKYAGLEKVIRAVENIGMGDSKPANEKYLSDYIKNNTPMRVKYNKEDNTYYYFLLGQWLPSYQAIDFLSQPYANIMSMALPIVKVPIELGTNQQSFFKDTLGQYQAIENYPGESTSYLGFSMPKKVAYVLRNIRLLNELDKLNPGKIFGGEKGEESLASKLNIPAVSTPAGVISPAKYKYGKTSPAPSGTERLTGLLAGKYASYKESQSKLFYQRDTDQRIAEYKSAIKKAVKDGDRKKADVLRKELRDFVKSRK